MLKKQERNEAGESRVYKVEIWIRTDVDIRVIVSVARTPPSHPDVRDLWAPS